MEKKTKKKAEEIEKEILREAAEEAKKDVKEKKVIPGKQKKQSLIEKAQETIKEVKKAKAEEKKPKKPKLERVYTLNLRQFAHQPRRTKLAIRKIKSYVMRHIEADEFVIAPELNEYVWARGYKKPPAKIRIKVERDEEGRALISLQK